MVLPQKAITESLKLSVNELVFAGRQPRSSPSLIFLSAFVAFVAFLSVSAGTGGKHAHLWGAGPARGSLRGPILHTQRINKCP